MSPARRRQFVATASGRFEIDARHPENPAEAWVVWISPRHVAALMDRDVEFELDELLDSVSRVLTEPVQVVAGLRIEWRPHPPDRPQPWGYIGRPMDAWIERGQPPKFRYERLEQNDVLLVIVGHDGMLHDWQLERAPRDGSAMADFKKRFGGPKP